MMHAFQRAQCCHLPIDLFTPEDLSEILEGLNSISSASGLKLLIKNPSDLQQVEYVRQLLPNSNSSHSHGPC